MAFISQLPSYQASAPDWGIMTNALAQSMQQYRQGMNEQFKGEMERNRLAMDRRRLSMDENADMRAALMHPLQLDALRASNAHAVASEARAAAMHPLQLGALGASNAHAMAAERRAADLFPSQLSTARTEAEIKQRELTSPAGKITIVPDGGMAIMTDPRTGKHQTLTAGQPKIDATMKKAIDEADDFVAQTHTAIGALNEALRLNQSAYSGIAAGGRATITNNVVPWNTPGARATTELENVVTNQALQSLRSTFGGNPTEGERKILLEVGGSVNQPVAVRANIYKRALQMAQQRLEINRQKAMSLRAGTYYKTGGQPQAVDVPVSLNPAAPRAAAPGGSAAPQQHIDDARAAIARGAPREKVIERLRSMGIDPGGL